MSTHVHAYTQTHAHSHIHTGVLVNDNNKATSVENFAAVSCCYVFRQNLGLFFFFTADEFVCTEICSS